MTAGRGFNIEMRSFGSSICPDSVLVGSRLARVYQGVEKTWATFLPFLAQTGHATKS